MESERSAPPGEEVGAEREAGATGDGAAETVGSAPPSSTTRGGRQASAVLGILAIGALMVRIAAGMSRERFLNGIGACLRDSCSQPKPSMSNHTERRLSPRAKVDLSGSVRFPKGGVSPCRVTDLSQTGAKLVFDGVHLIPEGFELMINGQRPRAVRRMWRSGSEVGVAFA